MKEMFIFTRFNRKSHLMIQAANEIIEEHMKSGLVLTLRQLYYQFVARDLIPNKQSEYKNLGNLNSRGRLSGYIDWDATEDRTRVLVRNPHWDSPADILDACVRGYAIDKWETQPYYVEAWIETEALAGVVQSICAEFHVPYSACRGYVSQSELYWAAKRLAKRCDAGKETTILHLADHDAKEIQVNVVLSDESLQDFIRYQERISPAQLSRAATIRLMMRDASANGRFGLTSKPIPGTAKRKRK